MILTLELILMPKPIKEAKKTGRTTSAKEKEEKETTNAEKVDTKQKDGVREKKESSSFVLETKVNRKVTLQDIALYRRAKRKVKGLQDWLDLIGEVDPLLTKARKAGSLSCYNELLGLLRSNRKRDLQADLKWLINSVEQEVEELLPEVDKTFRKGLADTGLQIDGVCPNYEISRVLEGSGDQLNSLPNQTTLKTTLEGNPTHLGRKWELRVDGQTLTVEESELARTLLDLYDYKYHQTINQIDLSLVFGLVLKQFSLFSRSDKVEVYITDYLAEVRKLLLQNQFLASEEFVKEKFVLHFPKLASTFNCKLNHARDNQKFVKLTFDEQPVEYSYITFPRTTPED